MSKKLTTREFIKRAREVHGDKYDYSKTKYSLTGSNVIIMCPKHGEFEQRANNHLAGSGCRKCSPGIYRYNTKSFIEAAIKVHGSKYDYARLIYNNASSKVTILCPTHGYFRQRASSHMAGNGCPHCRWS